MKDGGRASREREGRRGWLSQDESETILFFPLSFFSLIPVQIHPASESGDMDSYARPTRGDTSHQAALASMRVIPSKRCPPDAPECKVRLR